MHSTPTASITTARSPNTERWSTTRSPNRSRRLAAAVSAASSQSRPNRLMSGLAARIAAAWPPPPTVASNTVPDGPEPRTSRTSSHITGKWWKPEALRAPAAGLLRGVPLSTCFAIVRSTPVRRPRRLVPRARPSTVPRPANACRDVSPNRAGWQAGGVGAFHPADRGTVQGRATRRPLVVVIRSLGWCCAPVFDGSGRVSPGAVASGTP